jgi:hypothetical protein
MAAQGPLQYREAGFSRAPAIDRSLSPLPLWSAQWVPSAWTTRNLAVNGTTFDVPADVSTVHGGVVTEAASVGPGTYASETVYPFLVMWCAVFAVAMISAAFWLWQEADSIASAHAVKVKSKRVPKTLAVQ